MGVSFQGGLELEVHRLVGFGEVLAALGVAEDDILDAEVLEHSGRDFAGVGAIGLPVHILSAEADLRAFERGGGGRDVHEGHADNHLHPAIAFVGGLADALDKRGGLGGQLVHLPITCDDFGTHSE